MQARLGAPKAITAAAHIIGTYFYRLWTSGDVYSDPGIDAYEHQYQERMLKILRGRLRLLAWNSSRFPTLQNLFLKSYAYIERDEVKRQAFLAQLAT